MGAKADKEEEEITTQTPEDNEVPKKRKSTIRRFNSINR